ncbi:hypothetical protein FB45DRAFT_326700 [Roridomyces roridus]|uniref:Uncharacterized protein n=1 Tax=Roridomyces roridus TaxID=1738132 RepID=A0AAD7FBV0_9AGAR|nr:hypothetical protein FB45DRAFT_326700 [Roridomyces roridus]
MSSNIPPPLHLQQMNWSSTPSFAAAVDVDKALDARQHNILQLWTPYPRLRVSPDNAQTDKPGIAQMDMPIFAVATLLDWAEDASTLPTAPLPKSSPSSAVRDFSCLRSEAPAPLASIQRRRPQRSPQSRRPSHQNRCYSSAAASRTPPNHYYRQLPPFVPPPSTRAFPLRDSASLDWDQSTPFRFGTRTYSAGLDKAWLIRRWGTRSTLGNEEDVAIFHAVDLSVRQLGLGLDPLVVYRRWYPAIWGTPPGFSSSVIYTVL